MTKRIHELLNGPKKKLAILVDPEKTSSVSAIDALVEKLNVLKPTFIFVGGSTVSSNDMHMCLKLLRERTEIPLVIFPGSPEQVDEQADAILFMSLLSGRNPDYLIGHQVRSAKILKNMDIETISTAYLLIDGGKNSSVAYVSQTSPIPNEQTSIAVNTAVAGEMLGFQLAFLDAGSGAINPVPADMIRAVKNEISIPLIIGGGIKSIEEIESAYESGADVVVIGNKIEDDINFMLDLISYVDQKNLNM